MCVACLMVYQLTTPLPPQKKTHWKGERSYKGCVKLRSILWSLFAFWYQTYSSSGPGHCSCYSDSLWPGCSGDGVPVGGEIFRTCPDRTWGPPSLLYNGSFLEVKWPGGGIDNPLPSSVEVKERVELHFCSLSGPLWSVLGRSLSLLTPWSRVLLEKLTSKLCS
jgi:hypothetical protein